MECGGCLKQPPYSKSGVWRSLSGVWRLLETTSTLHSTPHDLGHKWSVEVTQIETKNEWSVEVFECFLRFGATVWRSLKNDPSPQIKISHAQTKIPYSELL